jgi:GAF domain-containing protein
MEFFRSLLPGYTHPEVKARGSLAVLRDRILQTLFLAIFAIGTPVISFAILDEINHKNWPVISFYIAIYIALILVILFRKIYYPARALVIISIAYALAISEFFDSGLPSEMRFYLIAAAGFSAATLGLWPGVISTGIGFLTLVVLNTALANGWIHGIALEAFMNDPNRTVGPFVFLLLSGSLTVVIGAILNGIQSGLNEKELIAVDLENQKNVLEETVRLRTSDIQLRLNQVRTAAEISRVISRLSDPNTLFDQVVSLVQDRFSLYYVGIFTVDNRGVDAVLRAGTGEAGKMMLTQNHHLAVGGNSMIGWCITNRQPRIALDVGAEAIRFNNPYLPQTRSEIALPILGPEKAFGAITVQSTIPKAFDQNDILVLQGIADTLSVAIENDRLFNELSQNLDEVRSLNQNYLQQAWNKVLVDAGELTSTYESGSTSTPGPSLQVINLPVSLREHMIGQISLETEYGQISADDAVLIEAITTQTALALENARLVQESERRVYQEQTLNDLATQFSRAIDIESILKTAAQQLGQLPSVSEVTVELLPAEYITQEPSKNANSRDGKEKLS